ncbi:MAG: hypothetical protein VYE77_11130 [Planctomycetota bacterium]|nr:hypothetical protein [Planctomycetota bacterium]
MNSLAPTVAALLAASSLQAQLPCESLNDATNNATGAITGLQSGGRVTSAWKITPQNNVTVESLRIWCGHNYYSQVVHGHGRDPIWELAIYDDTGVWSGHASVSLPGQRLGGGKWLIIDGGIPQWQGTNLDAPVSMTAGTSYWVLWTDPGWSNPPIQSGGTTYVDSWRLYNGVWTQLGSEALKLRMFCHLLEDQGIQPSGAPCPGSTNQLGTMFTNKVPRIGNQLFALEGSGFLPGQFGLTVFGLIPNFPSYSFPGLPSGCLIYTDAFATGGGVTGTGAMSGHMFAPVPMPSNTALANIVFTAQFGVFDNGLSSAIPMTTTNRLSITVLP